MAIESHFSSIDYSFNETIIWLLWDHWMIILIYDQSHAASAVRESREKKNVMNAVQRLEFASFVSSMLRACPFYGMPVVNGIMMEFHNFWSKFFKKIFYDPVVDRPQISAGSLLLLATDCFHSELLFRFQFDVIVSLIKNLMKKFYREATGHKKNSGQQRVIANIIGIFWCAIKKTWCFLEFFENFFRGFSKLFELIRCEWQLCDSPMKRMNNDEIENENSKKKIIEISFGGKNTNIISLL